MGSDAREQALRRLKAQRAFRNLLLTATGILVVMIAIWIAVFVTALPKIPAR